MALNKVLLIGNAGKDPEVRHLQGGAVTATITLATTERYKDRNGETKEQTEWHTVVAWRQTAEFVEKYVKKGSQLYVEGKIRTRSWDDQSGQKRYSTEIQADTIQLLGSRQTDEGQVTRAAAQVASEQHPVQQDSGAQQMLGEISERNQQSQPKPQPQYGDGPDDLPFE